jgi:hypothetical protein
VGGGESSAMAGELESMLIRKGVGQMSAERHSCARCSRTPLPGEQMHRFDSGRLLCDLCMAETPKGRGEPVASERVHVTDRALRVQPSA